MRIFGIFNWLMALASLILVGVALTGCGSGSDSSTETPKEAVTNKDTAVSPIEIVATVGMVADVVRNVGGSHVQVTQLMGPGVDPHLYKVTRDDVQKIMQAEMVFYSGLLLEGKMTDTLGKVSQSKPVVAVTQQVDQSTLLEPDDAGGHFDPHLWMDVSAWANTVDAVASSLGQYDPSNQDLYIDNAKKYKDKLLELHQYGVDSISTIPETGRVLITSHDAFNYFGRAYNLDVQGVQGLSTESEAGLQRINQLVDELVQKKIKAVFVESSVSRKNIDALIEGAKAKGHQVTVGGQLYSDAMGTGGTYEGTYIGMLDHNITLVTLALGGDAPETGFQGELNFGSSETE